MKPFCAYALLLLLLVAGVATAEERLPEDWELTIWQLSRHLDDAPEGRSFVEVNPGIGIRKYISKKECWEIFGDANYIVKNSTGGKATLIGLGGQCSVLSTGYTELLLGGVAGVTRYENAWEQKTYVTPGAYPFVGVRHKDLTLTMGYIPSIKSKSVYETLFVYANIRF